VGYRKSANRVVGRIAAKDLGDVDAVELLCMGDLHVGDSHCDLDMIRQSCAWLKEEPDRHAIIVGDLFNAALKDSVSDVYSEAMSVKDSRKMLIRLLEPVRDRILAVVSGNHDHRVYKAIGDDIVEIMCAEIGLPYYSGQAFLSLKVGWDRNQSRQQKRSPIVYTTYLTHGFGGGRMVGSKANNLMRLADIVDAELYVAGHTHTPMALPSVRWQMDANRGSVIEKQRMFISTGASLDRGEGYAVRFGFPALPKLWPIVRLDGREKNMTATL
jgi:predicted phosphodiesterase